MLVDADRPPEAVVFGLLTYIAPGNICKPEIADANNGRSFVTVLVDEKTHDEMMARNMISLLDGQLIFARWDGYI